MSWFRVDDAFADHPKTAELEAALNDPNAGMYVIRFWSWLKRFSVRGTFDESLTRHIEKVCRWPGEPGFLCSTLIEKGFIERAANGALEAHDWWDVQAPVVEKAEKDAARKRKNRAALVRRTSRIPSRGLSADASAGRRAYSTYSTDGTDSTDGTNRSAAPEKPAQPRETDGLCDDFKTVTGEKYRWQGAKDGKAFASLRSHASIEEIREQWRRGLRASGWLRVATVAQLAQKWNDLVRAASGDGLTGSGPITVEKGLP